MLEADTGLIEQVLINLVLNAAEAVKEAASPHPAFRLHHAAEQGCDQNNNGIGIPPDILDKIFHPLSVPAKQAVASASASANRS